jgi:hypothetical protein
MVMRELGDVTESHKNPSMEDQFYDDAEATILSLWNEWNSMERSHRPGPRQVDIGKEELNDDLLRNIADNLSVEIQTVFKRWLDGN